MSQVVDLSPKYVAPVADALPSCGVFDIPQASSSHLFSFRSYHSNLSLHFCLIPDSRSSTYIHIVLVSLAYAPPCSMSLTCSDNVLHVH